MAVKQSPTHVKLKNGTTVYVNDHVYLAPEHLGEPYYIGRVMEFSADGLEARIAWFIRHKDVQNLAHYDPAHLLATLNSEMNPVSSIQAKCKVVHKYYIPKDQFDSFRRCQDHFYYTQMYDRYMQRLFDLVPCETIQNMPPDVLHALTSRYQFIIVDQGKARDLITPPRDCAVCQEWCASAASVKCAGCQKNFHMACLTPPLARKPSKGFAWQCAPCSKLALDDRLNNDTRQGMVSTAAAAAAATAVAAAAAAAAAAASAASDTRYAPRATRSQSQAQSQTPSPRSPSSPTATTAVAAVSDKKKRTSTDIVIPKRPKVDLFQDPRQITTTNGWPFRYYGPHTTIKDIVDLEDRIYPLATSRIGAKYQATLPEMRVRSENGDNDGEKPMDVDEPQKPRRTGGTTTRSVRRDELQEAMVMDRGTDQTATLLFAPQTDTLPDNELHDYILAVQTLVRPIMDDFSPDTFDLALTCLQECGHQPTKALDLVKSRLDTLPHCTTWSFDEICAFEASVRVHGHDLQAMKSFVPGKTMADRVRFFYRWKKSDRYQPVYTHWTEVYRPTKQFKPSKRSLLDCFIDKRQLQDNVLMDKLKQHDMLPHTPETSSTDALSAGSLSPMQLDGDTEVKMEVKDDNDSAMDGDALTGSRASSRTTIDQSDEPENSRTRRSARQVTPSTRSSSRLSAKQRRPTYCESSDDDDDEFMDEIGAHDYENDEKDNGKAKAKASSPSTNDRVSAVAAIKNDTLAAQADNTLTPDNDVTDRNVIPKSARFTPLCANCGTTQSAEWRRYPGDLNRKRVEFDAVLCHDCGIYWLKYAFMRQVTIHSPLPHAPATSFADTRTVYANGKRSSPSANDKKLEAIKRLKMQGPTQCTVCRSQLFADRLVTCQNCLMDVHEDCYGIGQSRKQNWICDTCQNKLAPKISYEYHCRLCGQVSDLLFDALKPTSGFFWTHVTCALFFPETKVVDTTTYSPVEYVGAVSNAARQKTCEICQMTNVGACVTCHHGDCTRSVHVQCALKAQSDFVAGFVIDPCQQGDDTPVVPAGLFDAQSPSGIMLPVVFCADHPPQPTSPQHFYSMQTRCIKDQRSWIELYVQMYKTVDPNTTPAMRRYSAYLKRTDQPSEMYPIYTPSNPTSTMVVTK